MTKFLQRAHEADERWTARDGVNLARYALKRISSGDAVGSGDAVREAVVIVLGDEALRYLDDRE